MGDIESVHSGSDWDEAMLDAVAGVVRQAQGDNAMVQRFVVVVETIDAEDRWLSSFTAPEQKAWDSMGLLQYALTAEQNFRVIREDGEDEG